MADEKATSGEREEDERFKELLLIARDLPEQEREALLTRIAGEEAGLAQRLRRFLQATDSVSDDFLRPMQDRGAPRQMGPYQLVELLGRGAVGEVHRAKQEAPIQREVALKTVRFDRDSEETRDAIRNEGQTLARLNHGGLPAVLDVGEVPDGPSYFAMELIEGPPLTEYVALHHLDVLATLRLVIEAGSALQHAHDRGILHRDLQPANILVPEESTCPAPKLIDFGIASLGQGGVGSGSRGTLGYASPEQLAMLPGQADVRTDVYGLAAVLYHALTAQPPHEPARLTDLSSVARVQHITRTRILPLAKARGGAVARSRRGKQALPSHLDALQCILRAGLHPDQASRYPTVRDFVSDLSAWLEGRPLSVPPEDWWASWKALYKRRRSLILGLGLSLVALFATLGAVVWSLVQVDRERAALARALAESKALAGYFESAMRLTGEDELGPQASLVSFLDRLEEELPQQELPPRPLARVRLALGKAYLGLDRFGLAQHCFEEAFRLLDPPRDKEDGRNLASAAVRLGLIHLEEGRSSESETWYRRALEVYGRYPELDPGGLHIIRTQLAAILDERGDSGAAALLQQAELDALVAQGAKDRQINLARIDLAITRMNTGEYQRAALLAEPAFRQRLEEHGPVFYATVNAARVLAAAWSESERGPAVIELLQELWERNQADPRGAGDADLLRFSLLCARVIHARDVDALVELEALLGSPEFATEAVRTRLRPRFLAAALYLQPARRLPAAEAYLEGLPAGSLVRARSALQLGKAAMRAGEAEGGRRMLAQVLPVLEAHASEPYPLLEWLRATLH